MDMFDPAVDIPSDVVGNFRKVSDGLYAGARPKLPDGIALLKDLGIKTVIDLESAEPGEGPEFDEATVCGEMGITLHSISLPGIEILDGPPADKMAQIAALIADPSNAPVFVHCLHGADRTGAVVGQYRVEHGWSNQKAVDEMFRYHHSHLEVGYTLWVRDFRPE